MAWLGLPLTATSPISAYIWIIQFWEAARERWLATGQFWWPDASTPFGQGVVPSGITATSFTDTNANDGDGWTGGDNPWSSFPTDPRVEGLTAWYLVIDDCDYKKVIKTLVTSHTATTVNYESIQDYITAGYIPSLSSLEGKPYYFIRGDYGITWAERMLEFPNDYEFASGTATGGSTTRLFDTNAKWRDNEFSGRDCLVYADGALRRAFITGNTKTELIFSIAHSWVPDVGDDYIIVVEDGKGFPGKSQVYPFTYYRGARELVKGHYPAPTSGQYPHFTKIPVTNVHHPDVDSFDTGCEPAAPFLAIDVDYISEWDPSTDQLECGYPAEKFFAPDFHKTLRALQINCEQLGNHFVEKKDYENVGAMPVLIPALLFKVANIGFNVSTTVGSVAVGGMSAELATGVTFPYYPIAVHWAVFDSLGEPLRWGQGSMTSSTHLESGTSFFEIDDEDKVLQVGTGWPRHFPREVQRMFYPKTAFIPGTVSDEGVTSAIVPPTVADFAEIGCTGAGRWEYRAVSTKYWEQGIYGPEESDTFVTGELARYAGDNWNDRIDGTPELTDYFDHFYTGQFPSVTQAHRRAQRRGKPTSATSTSLTDTNQNWWDEKWYTSSVSHSEQGTATGGSTTSLTDSTKAPTTPETAPNCWWKTDRFTNFTGPYVGFTVEILISGSGFSDPAAVIEKRLITAGSSSAVSVTWDVPLSTSASGKQYRIREPAYNLNRWDKHQVRFTYTDGTSGTATIRGNDDTTLFFTAGLEKEIDLTKHYRIIEHETGTVWKWDGSNWVKPTGADSVRKFVDEPNDFIYWSPGDLPTYKVRYGWMLPRDDVATVLHALYKVFNQLVWLREDVVWDNPDELDNFIESVDTGDDQAYPTWTNLFTTGYDYDGGGFTVHNNSVEENWDIAVPIFNGPGHVPMNSAEGRNHFCDSKGGRWTRQMALGRISLSEVSCPISSVTEFWVFSTINEDDPDDGEFVCTAIEHFYSAPGSPDITYYNHAYSQFKFQGGPDGVHFRAFHKWDEIVTPAATLERLSNNFLGNITSKPSVPVDPAGAAASTGCHTNPVTPLLKCTELTPTNNYDYESSTYEGWYAKKAYGLLKFDVEGGFSKWA